MISYEEALKVLQKLKESAESVDRNEDSVFADYRGVASHDFREIVDTLVGLDLDGHILAEGETKEGYLIGVLRRLKDSAEIFDKYEGDYIEDYRNWADSEKRDIVETLLVLDFNEKGLETLQEVKSEVSAPMFAMNEEAQVVDTEAFQECMLNCDWIIEQAKELKALLGYNSVRMVELNGARAVCAVDSIRAALKDVSGFIDELVSPAKPLGDVIASATQRSCEGNKDQAFRAMDGMEK